MAVRDGHQLVQHAAHLRPIERQQLHARRAHVPKALRVRLREETP